MTNELTTALASLPVFSARVLQTLLKGLYAEPGYSDVDANDIAKELGVSPKAVGGALSHLQEWGLVFVEEVRVNNKTLSLVYVQVGSDPLALHDDEGTREQAIAFLETVINGKPAKAEAKKAAAVAEAKAEEAKSEPLSIALQFRPGVDEMLQLDERSLYYGEYEVISVGKTALKVSASVRAAKAMLEDCRDRSTPEGGYDQPKAWYRVAKAAAKVIETALTEQADEPKPAKKSRKSADELDLDAEKLAYKRAQWRKWNKMYRERKKAAKAASAKVERKAKKVAATAKKGGRKAPRKAGK